MCAEDKNKTLYISEKQYKESGINLLISKAIKTVVQSGKVVCSWDCTIHESVVKDFIVILNTKRMNTTKWYVEGNKIVLTRG